LHLSVRLLKLPLQFKINLSLTFDLLLLHVPYNASVHGLQGY
jgi:hypothetical protein